MIPILDIAQWQMTSGERAALEGVLSQLRPQLAIEIGTAEGGSLRCIASHSAQVHSFDLVVPQIDADELPNVTLHTGDNHVLLPQVLAELAAEGLNVDFALVDGDHTAAGVEQDVRDLLASDAVNSTVIMFHDTLNDEVRAGLQRIDVASEPKIAHFDLDLVTGRLNYGGVFHHQLWGGLGLMVVDPDRAGNDPGVAASAYEPFELLAPVRDALVAQEATGAPTGPGHVREALTRSDPSPELAAAQAELVRVQARYDEIANSKSWLITAPLRAAMKRARSSS